MLFLSFFLSFFFPKWHVSSRLGGETPSLSHVVLHIFPRRGALLHLQYTCTNVDTQKQNCVSEIECRVELIRARIHMYVCPRCHILAV